MEDLFEVDYNCRGCPFLKETREAHPYGSTVAYEYWEECTCKDASDCPKVFNEDFEFTENETQKYIQLCEK